jgi:hypothetical protein
MLTTKFFHYLNNYSDLVKNFLKKQILVEKKVPLPIKGDTFKYDFS